MKILIPIQSVSDIITNSSSETFLLDADKYQVEQVKEILQPIIKANEFPWDRYRGGAHNDAAWDAFEKDQYSDNPKYDGTSGNGGDWSVDSFTDDLTKEKFVCINIDHSMRRTIDSIRELFEIKEVW